MQIFLLPVNANTRMTMESMKKKSHTLIASVSVSLQNLQKQISRKVVEYVLSEE